MSGAVRTIFTTLIKVPIYVAIAYLCFNVFAFTVVYFRLQSLGHVAMYTTIENNYIPADELVIMNRYRDSLQDTTMVLSNVEIIPPAGREQYGAEVTTSVRGNYNVVWPLMPNEQTHNTNSEGVGVAVSGMDDTININRMSGAELEAARDAKRLSLPIEFSYTVPGLKYYPDLDSGMGP